MIVYKIRPDGVYEGQEEMEDNTVIPAGYTWSQPPEIPDGYYATLRGSWELHEGSVPPWPPIVESTTPTVLTSTQKLANAGLTVDELKILLGL